MKTLTKIKEKPILFSTPMVKAILEGRKTQTRRVVKPQPFHGEIDNGQLVDEGKIHHCKYEIGDHLWVRETHIQIAPMQAGYGIKNKEWLARYKADEDDLSTKWTPSIFMPRWASRITLEITSVEVERVQEISLEDCGKEGVNMTDGIMGSDDIVLSMMQMDLNSKFDEPVPRLRFWLLWNSINAKRGHPFEANPFVWKIEFKRIEQK